MSHKPKKQQTVNHVRKVSSPPNRQVLLLTIAGAAILIFVLAAILGTGSRIPVDFVPQVQGAPSIAVVSDAVLEHGDLVVNNFVTSSFEIQNVGDETLVVLTPWVQVHEGCCPPQAEISNKRLRPGEIATVSMRYTMHPGMDGPHDLRIHLRSNDPINTEIELTALSNWVSS